MLKTLTKEKKIGRCFQLLFLQIFFLPFLSFSSVTPIISMLVQVFQALFIFLHSFFFLLLRLDNFIWPIHKFTDSFFCLLKSVIKLLYWFFFLIVLIVLFNFFSCMIWHLNPCWLGRDCSSQGESIPRESKGLILKCVFRIQIKQSKARMPNQLPPLWSSYTPGNNFPVLITPGWDIRQWRTAPTTKSPLKLFKLDNPKCVYPALPIPFHENHNKDCFPHFPPTPSPFWLTLVLLHVLCVLCCTSCF